jgi:PAS domain S-box-containing protein
MKKNHNTRFVKILAGILVSVFILLFWYHYNSLNKSTKIDRIQAHTDEVVLLLDNFILYLFDVEVAQNNYVLSKNENFLDQFKKDKENLILQLENLKQTARFSFAEKNKFDTLSMYCFEKISDWENELMLVQTGQMEKLIKSKDASEIKMNRIEEVTASFHDLETGFIRKYQDKINAETKSSFNVLAIGASIIGVIIVALFITLFIEIKRREKTESELFVSNEWHSKTLSSMGDGVISTDKNGSIIFLNKIAEDITGWKNEDVKNKSIDEIFIIVNSKTKLTVENPVKKALKENRIVFLEEQTLLVKKDGSTINIDDSAAPVVDDNGKIIGGVLIFRDTTEQEANKRKLIKSERFLKDIINNTTSLIIIKDINSKFLLVNPQYEKVFNCFAVDIIGKHISFFHSADLVKKFEVEDNEVIQSGKIIQFENSVTHADGSEHFYHTVKFPLYDSDGKVYGVCAVSTDISESKNNIEMKEKLASQEIILKSEIKYSELTENLPSMFFSLNHNLEVIHWNKACEEFNGLKAEKVIGKKFTDIIPYVINGVFYSHCEEVLMSANSKSFSHKITFKDTDYFHFTNIYPTLQGISILMTNVTEQKRAEQETIEHVENLQQRNKELRQFAYIVSHNLRAPIAKIQGLASLFSGDQADIELNQTLIKNLNDEAVNLDIVVKDLNTIVSSRDSDRLEKEEIFFDSEIELIRQVLSNEITECDAEIKTDFSAVNHIYSVKSYIYSILFNLVSNAIKYCAPDRACEIDLKTELIGDCICLTVKDNGIGIDMEKNGDKIFGLYKRFHGDSMIPGKGMGLHLVKTQTESLGGRTEVESKIDKGTTFKIFLPYK